MIRQFHRPTTVDEALRLKASLGESAQFLAGGSFVNSGAFERPCNHLIDLAGLDLKRFEAWPGGIALGAGLTLQDLADSAVVPPALRQAARQVGNRNIRNAATLGGQLAAGQPTAALLPALVALEAIVLEETSAGTREHPVEQVLDGGPSGLITWIQIPTRNRGVGLAKFGRTANDLAVMTAAASLELRDGVVEKPIVVIGGLTERIIRLRDVENVLARCRSLPEHDRLEALVRQAVSPMDDHRYSADFKRHTAGVLVADSLAAAWQGASR